MDMKNINNKECLFKHPSRNCTEGILFARHSITRCPLNETMIEDNKTEDERKSMKWLTAAILCVLPVCSSPHGSFMSAWTSTQNAGTII